MPADSTVVRVWDVPLRVFHWLLVVVIAVAFLSAEEDSALNQWHVAAGWAAGLLILFRLTWGFLGGEHSRFTDFIRPSRIADHLKMLRRGRIEPSLGHNPLGAIAVVVLLGLVAAVVWTGAFGSEAAEDLHEVVGWTLLAMVGIHIAAVVAMSMLERENLVRAMITGTKSRLRHADAQDAQGSRPGGMVVALAVTAAAAYAILQYDPQAFTPRSAESFEHRGDTSAPMPASQEQEDKD